MDTHCTFKIKRLSHTIAKERGLHYYPIRNRLYLHDISCVYISSAKLRTLLRNMYRYLPIKYSSSETKEPFFWKTFVQVKVESCSGHVGRIFFWLFTGKQIVPQEAYWCNLEINPQKLHLFLFLTHVHFSHQRPPAIDFDLLLLRYTYRYLCNADICVPLSMQVIFYVRTKYLAENFLVRFDHWSLRTKGYQLSRKKKKKTNWLSDCPVIWYAPCITVDT